MSLVELPSDSHYYIGLNLPYRELVKFCSLSKDFAKICHSQLFWTWKAMKDFGINKDEYNYLYKFTEQKTDRNFYIYLAGLDDIPIIGAEISGDLFRLMRNALINSYIPELLYFFSKSNIGYLYDFIIDEIVKMGRIDVIGKLVENFPQWRKNILYISITAITKHESMSKNIKKLLRIVSGDIKGSNRRLLLSVADSSLSLMKYLFSIFTINQLNLNKLAKSAANYGHVDVLEYLINNGASYPKDKFDKLKADTKMHKRNVKLLQNAIDMEDVATIAKLIELGYRTVGSHIIKQVSKSGNFQFFEEIDKLDATAQRTILYEIFKYWNDDLIIKFIDGYNVNPNEILLYAVKYRNLNMVKLALSMGPVDLLNPINIAIKKGDLASFQEILGHMNSLELIDDEFILNAANSAIKSLKGKHWQMVKILLDYLKNGHEELLEVAIYNGDVNIFGELLKYATHPINYYLQRILKYGLNKTSLIKVLLADANI